MQRVSFFFDGKLTKCLTALRLNGRTAHRARILGAGEARYAKIGGDFSEALQANEWAKFTDGMTNMDAGLRISVNSLLIPCESGIFKYVIYYEISNNNIIAVYRFGRIKYNNVIDIDISATKIAKFIYEQENKRYAKPKILRRLLRDHCKNFGYILDQYNPNSKQYASIGNGIVKDQKNDNGQSNGTGISQKTVGGISKVNKNTIEGKKSVDDSIEDRDLAAVHNLSEEKLQKGLKLGGIPMPSIAVTKHDSQHEGIMKKRTPATGILFMAERRGFEPLVR